MSTIDRREMLQVSALLSLGTPASLFVDQGIASGSLSAIGVMCPRLIRHDYVETCIDLGRSIPTLSATEQFERLLMKAGRSRRTSVLVAGRMAPVGGFDERYSAWISLCERFGVNEITERSSREPVVTPPLRVGQIDPAGIVYRITS